MKKIFILIAILLVLPFSLRLEATLVPLDGTFWDAGVLTSPESLHVKVWGNGAIVDSMWDASPDSVYHDTLNRDYSAYDLLRLEWKIYFTSGTFTTATEDMSYLLTRDVNKSILDTLQNHDDWVAHQSTSDSLYDSLLIVLDSLEALEGWVATAAELTKAIDSINAILDSIQLPLNVNVTSVDANAIGIGDFAIGAINSDAIGTNAIGHNELAIDAINSDKLATSAANEIADAVRAEGIVCYNQSDSTFELAGLHIRAIGTDDTAFIATGDGAGHGMYLMGGLTGSGLYADAGHTIAGATGYGILARGKGDGKGGMYLLGDSGNVHALYLNAHGTGTDMLLHGSHNIKGYIDSSKYIAVAGENRLTDAVWDEDTTGHYTAPHMGYMASQTGASGSDTTAIKAMHNNNPGLVIVEDTLADGEEMAFMPQDWTAADSGAYQGPAAGLDSTAVYGAVEQLMADSVVDVNVVEISGNSDAPDSLELMMVDTTFGLSLSRFRVVGTYNANAVFFVKNCGISPAVRFQGDGGALSLIGTGSVNAVGISSASGHDVGLGGDGRIAGTIDTVSYVKAGGYGRGSRTITKYLIDTAGTDTALAGVQINVKYLSGKRYVELTTNSSGCIEFVATEGDTLLYWINSQPWHIFPNAAGGDSTFVTTGADITDSSWGYDAEITTPSGDSTCVCYLYAYDAGNNPEKGVVLVAQLLGRNIEDTCTNTVISYKIIEGTASDATGYCSVEVTWTACLFNCDEVKLGVRRGSNTNWLYKVAIPSQTTWRITRE